METPQAITQHTSIREADQLLTIGPILARPDDDLLRLAELAVEQPATRVISVVDAEERLVGLISVSVLVEDCFLKIVPEEFLAQVFAYEQALEYAERLGAHTARDIMGDPVSVRPDETVRDAFERMHRAKLNGLPITDASGRVIGHVDQLELLLVWVRAVKQSARLASEPGGSA